VGHIQVGSRLFEYSGQTDGFASYQPPSWGGILTVTPTNCFELDLTFATDTTGGVAPNVSNAHVIQSSGETVASARSGQVGTLKTKLDGGTIQIEANSSDGAQVFANGYALCAN
jgi:hypothetical protein